MGSMRMISLSAVAAVLIASAAGCGGSQPEVGNAPEGSSDTAQTVEGSTAGAAKSFAISVEAAELQPESFKDIINVVGTVKPAEDIRVASEEGGKVAKWFVPKGAFVKAGQTIVKLNDDLLVSQLAAAEAQFNIAKLNAEKSEKVFADAGAVSEVSVTTAQYNVDAAEANVQILKKRIEKTSIKAPVSGRIDERVYDIGEMVPPGGAVARLIQTGTVKVTMGVPERYVEGIRVGLPVVMTFDALGGREVTGKITYVGAAIDDRNRTVPVEVELSNPRGEYTPEMIVSARITKDELRNVIVVPRTALIRVEDGYQVYVAARRGDHYVAEARQVTLGPADGGKVVVTEGLNPGDRIITVGQGKVNPGEQVKF